MIVSGDISLRALYSARQLIWDLHGVRNNALPVPDLCIIRKCRQNARDVTRPAGIINRKAMMSATLLFFDIFPWRRFILQQKFETPFLQRPLSVSANLRYLYRNDSVLPLLASAMCSTIVLSQYGTIAEATEWWSLNISLRFEDEKNLPPERHITDWMRSSSSHLSLLMTDRLNGTPKIYLIWIHINVPNHRIDFRGNRTVL